MATETVEETVEKLEIPVRFAARKATELRLVLKERHPIYDNAGLRLGNTDGITAEFKSGLFETDDPEVVALLRAHPGLNMTFVEVGAEPDRVPSSGPMIERVMKATAELDAVALEEILAEERQGYDRPDVIAACEAAIRRVHGIDSESAGA